MKRKNILLLLCFFLSSCNGLKNDNAFREHVYNKLGDLKEVTYSNYTLSIVGHVAQFDKLEKDEETHSVIKIEANKKLNDSDPTIYNINPSYLLLLPMHITQESFCPSDFSEPEVGYTYNRFKDQLIYLQDHVTVMEFAYQNDEYLFYSKGVSKYLTFNHVYAEEEFPDPIEAYGRYNITATYNDQGLLIKEEVKTVSVNDETYNDSVDISVSYNYS